MGYFMMKKLYFLAFGLFALLTEQGHCSHYSYYISDMENADHLNEMNHTRKKHHNQNSNSNSDINIFDHLFSYENDPNNDPDKFLYWGKAYYNGYYINSTDDTNKQESIRVQIDLAKAATLLSYFIDGFLQNDTLNIDDPEKIAEAYYYLALCNKNYNLSFQSNYRSSLKTAAELFEMAGKLGHTDAWYQLANCYLNGENHLKEFGYDYLEKNTTKFFEYLKKAADKEHVEACYQIWKHNYDGDVEFKDVKNPTEYLKKAADKEHVEACYQIWKHNYDGDVEFKDVKNPTEYLKKAADKEHVEACYQIWKHNYDGDVEFKDVKNPTKYLKIAADNWHSEACYRLSFHYYYDYEEKFKELDEPIDYLKRAVDKGHIGAILLLGMAIYEGLGSFDKNHKEAALCFNLVLKSNDRISDNAFIDAHSYLGYMHYYGNGVEKSLTKASSHFEEILKYKKYDEMYYKTCYCLGHCYSNSDSSFKADLTKAQKYLEEAAKSGHSGAKNFLEKNFPNSNNKKK